MADRLVSVNDAARRLGVNSQRVRALITNGRLPAQQVGGRYVIDASALEQFAGRARARGRPLSSANAWAVLARLSGRDGFASRPSSSRARLDLLIARGPEAVLAALERAQPRAADYHWRVLPNVERMLADPRVVKSGLSAQAKGIDIRYDAARDGLDAYVSQLHLEELRQQLHPIENSDAANVRLRVPIGARWILEEDVAPAAVVAADLLGHRDQRADRAGRQVIKRLTS